MERLKTIPVTEYTTPSPMTLGPETPVRRIFELMETNSIRHFPVVEDGKPVGIISSRDLNILAGYDLVDDLNAGDIMIPEPFTAGVQSGLDEVVFTMSREKIGSVLILEEDDSIYGIFTSTDALNALIEVLRGDCEAL